jgi:outer membrane receptor protein involved in Fe transport
VELRGSSNFRVFIDGKPSVLDGNEALQQIPANTIESIEVITNPSVKYDPDGTAGIINIKLKKNRLEGFSGIVDVTAATGDKYASDLYLNYKAKRVNIYGGVDWNDRVSPSTGNEEREIYSGDTTFFQHSTIDQAWRRNGWNFKAGMDISITDNSTLSFGGEYGTGGFGWDRFRNIREFTTPATSEKYYLDNNVFRWERDFFSANLTFVQEFRQEGHELKLFGFYSGRDGSQKQDRREILTDANWQPLESDPYLLRSTEAGPSKNFRFEADYVKPILDNGKFEAGYHYRLDDDAEDYFLEEFDYDLGQWVRDDRYTRETTFDRTIHAVYGIFSHEYKGFQYQLGLRGEYNYRRIDVLNENVSSVVDRFDYFPSVHISKRVKEKNQFMGSYSRRIERPRSWYLEPFVTYVDESTRRIGNPDLLPEYTDSFEVGYLRTLESGTFTIESYYRNTQNKITRISTFDQESGYFINTFENLNDDQALGIESSFIYDITKWFNLNLSATYYYYQLEDLTGQTNSTRSSNNWDSRLMASFKLPTNTRLQLNMSYDSPSVTAQGRREGFFATDFTARQEFFDKALSITLRVSDIFASRAQVTYSFGQDFYEYEYRLPESRIVSLTVSYRLNNFKKNPNLNNTGGGGGM